MTPDPTLHARLLIAGAAIEFPIVTGTTFRPMGTKSVYVSIECRAGGADHLFSQWCPVEDVDDVVCAMVSCVWALNGKLAGGDEAQAG